jgi:hypothetical protein
VTRFPSHLVEPERRIYIYFRKPPKGPGGMRVFVWAGSLGPGPGPRVLLGMLLRVFYDKTGAHQERSVDWRDLQKNVVPMITLVDWGGV